MSMTKFSFGQNPYLKISFCIIDTNNSKVFFSKYFSSWRKKNIYSFQYEANDSLYLTLLAVDHKNGSLPPIVSKDSIYELILYTYQYDGKRQRPPNFSGRVSIDSIVEFNIPGASSAKLVINNKFLNDSMIINFLNLKMCNSFGMYIPYKQGIYNIYVDKELKNQEDYYDQINYLPNITIHSLDSCRIDEKY